MICRLHPSDNDTRYPQSLEANKVFISISQLLASRLFGLKSLVTTTTVIDNLPYLK